MGSEIELVGETALVRRVDPGALLAQAIDKGASVEQLERLLAMRRELKAEFAREQYFAALAKFQAQCPPIAKGKDVKDKQGKHRYSYAPLDVIVAAVKEGLDLHGFSYTVRTKQDEKSVTAECHAHHVDGHSEVSAFTIPMDATAYMNESQKIASAMTYAKRYAFCNAFGIMTSDADDDAQSTGDPGEVTDATAHMENWRWTEIGRAPQSYWKAADPVTKTAALVEEFGPGQYKVEKGPSGWAAFRRLGVDAEPGQHEIWTPEAEDQRVEKLPADLPMATPTGKGAHTLGDRLTTLIMSNYLTPKEREEIRADYRGKCTTDTQRKNFLTGWEKDIGERGAAAAKATAPGADPSKVTMPNGEQQEIPY